MQKSYLLLVPIEPVNLGECYTPGTKLPLHCTVMPWFAPRAWDGFRSALHTQLSAVTRRRVPLQLQSSHFAHFGSTHEVPVHVLRRTTALEQLHHEILLWLDQRHVQHKSPCYIGSAYRPHVSKVGDRQFFPGCVHEATELVLVYRDARRHKYISQCYPLGPRPHR